MDKNRARKLENRMIREYGIGIRIHINPRPLDLEIFGELRDQPSGRVEIGAARDAAKENNLEFAAFDMSKPGDPPFSEKIYIWGKSIDLRDMSKDIQDEELEKWIVDECRKFTGDLKNAEDALKRMLTRKIPEAKASI